MKIDNLVVSYDNKQNVIENLTIEFPENKISVILAPSGAGKTTLLNVIAGAIAPNFGEITPQGYKISYIFQEPRLFEFLSALENVELFCPKRDEIKKRQLCMDALKKMKLKNDSSTLPKNLSQGMKQRVNIARALCHMGDVLLCDEPTSALDVGLGEEIAKILVEEKARKTVILATHDINTAVKIADIIYVFSREKMKLERTFTKPQLLSENSIKEIEEIIKNMNKC